MRRQVARFSLISLCGWILWAWVMWAWMVLAPSAHASARSGSLDWLTLETPHFSIHFQAGQEAPARRVGYAAEEAHAALIPLVGHTPQEKTQIVLMDRSDLANGFVDSALYNRMILYPVSPTGVGYAGGISPAFEDWIRLLLIHEYTHVLHLDMNLQVARGVRALFGHVPGLTTPVAGMGPMWVEGFAVLQESTFDPAGRARNPLFDMFLRTEALAGMLPSLDQALGHYQRDRWIPAAGVYLYGASFLSYLQETYGSDTLRQIHEEFASYRASRLVTAVRVSLDTELDRLWQDWQTVVSEKARRQARDVQADGLVEGELLHHAAVADMEIDPGYSPDGRFIAYAVQGKGVPGVRLHDLATGRDTQAAVGLAGVLPGLTWAPDGRRITYAQVDEVDGRLVSDLYEVDVATGVQTRLTRGARAYAPAYSPDGKWLTYVERNGLSTRVVAVPTAPFERPTAPGPTAPAPAASILYAPQDGTQVFSLSWSPDGTRLALNLWHPGGYTDIAVAGVGYRGLELSDLRFVTQDRPVDSSPVWSPDGRYILFDSDRLGIYNLYAAEVNTGRLYQLTNVVTGAFNPAVSPSSDEIAYMHYTADGYRLARLDWKSALWKLIPTPANQPGDVRPGKAALLPGNVVRLEGVTSSSIRTDDWSVHPYQPWTTLAPKWWLPVQSSDEAGRQLGLVTSGMDALGAQAFTLDVRYGIDSQHVAGEIFYGHLLSADLGVVLKIVLSDGLRYLDSGTWAVRKSAQVEVSGGRSGVLAESQWRLGWNGWVDQAPRAIGSSPLINELYGGLEWASTDGEGLIWRRRAGRLEATHRFTHLSVSSAGAGRLADVPGRIEAAWGETIAMARSWEWGWNWSAGLSGLTEGFHVGGPEGRYRLRGIDPGSLLGRQYVLGGLHWTTRLRTVERGWSDWPLFVNRLDGSLFVDAGAVWNAGWSGVASVGGELHLVTEPSYGARQLTWRLGVAKPITSEREAKLYLVVDGSF